MRSMLLTAFLVLAAGPLRAAQDADKAAGKPEAKPAKTAAKAAEAASTAPTKPAPSQEDTKPKTRTLQDLIDLVMNRGGNMPIGSPSAENLGLPTGTIGLGIRYKSSISPDGMTHGFLVIGAKTGGNVQDLSALVWRTLKLSRKDGEKHIDESWDIRLSTEGVVQSACRAMGKPGNVQQTVFPADSPEVQKVFQRERNFYLKDSMDLEISQ